MTESAGKPANPERLMPDDANPLWRAVYAARAGNWRLARWQLSEMSKLFHLCTITRPKYAHDIAEFLHEDVEPLLAAVAAGDLGGCGRRRHEGVEEATEIRR